MKSDREIERDARDEFDNSFDVPLPPAEAWPILSDIRRIAPCMSGAELTDVLDEATYQDTPATTVLHPFSTTQEPVSPEMRRAISTLSACLIPSPT
jgi:hypothetical protein